MDKEERSKMDQEAGPSECQNAGPTVSLPEEESSHGSEHDVSLDKEISGRLAQAVLDDTGSTKRDVSPDVDERQLECELQLNADSLGSRLLKYKFRKGIAVIINNSTFKNPKNNRYGSNEDESHLRAMFSELKFDLYDEIEPKQEVEPKTKDLTFSDMKTLMEKVAGDERLLKYDCFACAVLTHGGTGDKIYGSDDAPWTVPELTKCFNAEKCKNLIDKPKLFFIQACRGKSNLKAFQVPSLGSRAGKDASSEDEEEEEEEKEKRYVPNEADMLIVYSTPIGYISMRHTRLGTPFITTLCEVFKKYAKRLEIQHMLTMVNYVISEDYALHICCDKTKYPTITSKEVCFFGKNTSGVPIVSTQYITRIAKGKKLKFSVVAEAPPAEFNPEEEYVEKPLSSVGGGLRKLLYFRDTPGAR